MVASIITDTIEGTVERVNGHGFTLEGREGWVNLSRFADPVPHLPADGQRVRVGLDKAGFARSVEVVSAPVPARGSTMPENGPQPVETASTTPDRDTRIMRHAVLNTATAILASGGRAVEPGRVLTVAAQLEAWVLRD